MQHVGNGINLDALKISVRKKISSFVLGCVTLASVVGVMTPR
jgi:hypothetical protein